MTSTVNELQRVFGSFDGDRENLTPFNDAYPGKPEPVKALLDFKIRK